MLVDVHASNSKSCVWAATDFSEGDQKEKLFCVRFGSAESYTKEVSRTKSTVQYITYLGLQLPVLVAGVLRFVIDGNKVILSASNPETKVDDAELEENEVYSVDIVTSTGDRLPEINAWLSLGTKTKKKGDGKKKEGEECPFPLYCSAACQCLEWEELDARWLCSPSNGWYRNASDATISIVILLPLESEVLFAAVEADLSILSCVEHPKEESRTHSAFYQ
ncbi:hypothetical protein IFM89_011801 [Coptis chinensis]|uniref:Uncharacterized protein n=1 Tax=Coptis chinensis TaxID=261450 RepID=A0A835H2K7_9MAGN|nr:hypothetical protein IFM89_011801 [Coptis chinensis]